jgi:hypothetical protein
MNNRIEHRSAGGIIFEPNKKLGYYLVNNEIYYNKNHALLAASAIKDTVWAVNDDPVKWSFNEDVFIKFPWHIEPDVPLRELYRMRAQQLRDRYDYIRLELSGGGDSTTVLFSFLLNHIHLDEVVVRHPKKGDKDVADNPWDTKSENHLSEWEYAAKPLLKWLSINYPQVKITVHDFVDDMVTSKSHEENWIFKTRHYIHPSHAHKHSLEGIADHQKQADKNLSIAILYGVDKPKMCVKDGKFFLYFVDSHSNNSPEIGDYTNLTNEFFYWSPDMPELLAKQAHLVKNWFSLPVNYKYQNVLNWPNNSWGTRTFYEQLLRPIVYPDYDFNTFQTVKSTQTVFCEMDYWFFANFQGTDLYNIWEAGVSYLTDNLDERYLRRTRGQVTDIKQYQTPFYYLGESTIPAPTIPFSTKETLDAARNSQTKYVHCINGRLSIY